MPTKQTLSKYGLSLEEWDDLFLKYNGACHVCKKVPSSGRLNIDHFHVKGWKNMQPEERKKYVRGLLCYVCNNRILTKGVTAGKLESAAEYLREWETKRPPE